MWFLYVISVLNMYVALSCYVKLGKIKDGLKVVAVKEPYDKCFYKNYQEEKSEDQNSDWRRFKQGYNSQIRK